VSPDGWVDRTAKAPVRGTGDAAGEAVGEAGDEAVGDAAAVVVGEVAGEMTAFAEGDAPAYEPGLPQAAMSTATANQVVDCFTADILGVHVSEVRRIFRGIGGRSQGDDEHARERIA
jgi:hypothetical protein